MIAKSRDQEDLAPPFTDMPNPFALFSILIILLATVAGALKPLRDQRADSKAYPLGESFAAGVFLGLGLAMMLPASFHLFERALPDVNQPIASLIAISSLLILLGLSHFVRHLEQDSQEMEASGGNPSVPIIMTVMIAVPSFFMGAALGVSETRQAVLILIAILLHKSSAAFALALKLTDSSLGLNRSRAVFALFALSTPVGILVGGGVAGQIDGHDLLLARATVLAMAAGTFLFMGTLNDLQSAPLIQRCRHWRSFIAMVAGLGVTVCARLLIGDAHSLG